MPLHRGSGTPNVRFARSLTLALAAKELAAKDADAEATVWSSWS